MNTSNLETFTLPKMKTSKFHRKPLKTFLKKLGLQSQFSKFDKTPLFWPFMAQEVVVIDFIQNDFEMAPHLLEQMERFFIAYINIMRYNIPERELNMTVYESIEMTRRFRHGVRGTLKEGTKVHALCEEWIEHLWRKDILDMQMDQFTHGLTLMNTLYSTPTGWIYGDELEVDNHPSNPLKLRYKITVHRKKAEIYNREGEHLRRYHRLEYCRGGGEFGYRECSYEGKSYAVYLQSHAIKRVEERCHLKPNQLHYQLLVHVNFDDIRTYCGSKLIPYYMDSGKKYKIGYLVGDLVEDRLLINTFLFLAQDGTPEGDKLNELLKVAKLEKEFLQLDELRYFTNSDLKEDEELLPILKTCHLDHILELKINDPAMDMTKNADFIKEMIYPEIIQSQERIKVQQLNA